jgi:hypothetical protein
MSSRGPHTEGQLSKDAGHRLTGEPEPQADEAEHVGLTWPPDPRRSDGKPANRRRAPRFQPAIPRRPTWVSWCLYLVAVSHRLFAKTAIDLVNTKLAPVAT